MLEKERITQLVQSEPISRVSSLLIDRIHHSIQIGNSVTELIQQYTSLLREVESYTRDPASKRISQQSGSEWQMFIFGLIRRAIDANQPQTTSELLALLNSQDRDAIEDDYEYLQAHNGVIAQAKAITKKHKLYSQAYIRDKYSTTLYNPDISDAAKRTLWTQQWDPQYLSELPDTPTTALALLKMGKIDQVRIRLERSQTNQAIQSSQVNQGNRIGEVNPVNQIDAEDQLLAVNAYKRGVFNLFAIELNTSLSYEIVNSLVKRGYFQAFKEFIQTIPLEYTIFNLVNEANNMHLSQLELINAALVKVINATIPVRTQPSSPEFGLVIRSPIKPYQPVQLLDLYPLAIEYGQDNLFRELRLAYPGSFNGRESLIYLLQTEARLTIRHVNILNTILSENKHPQDAELLKRLRIFLRNNVSFFIEIYNKYGREQFVDSLIYLRSQFEIVLSYDKLLTSTISLAGVELLAYMFNLNIDYDSARPLSSLILGQDNSLLDATEYIRVTKDGLFPVDYPSLIKLSLGQQKPELAAVLLLIKHYIETGQDRLKLRG